MEYMVKWNFLATAICVIMIMSPTGFAGDGTQWGSTPTQTYNREVSAPSQGDASQSIQSPQADPSRGGQNLPPIPGNDSPISLPDDQVGEIPQELTNAESVAVLGRVDELINMALDSMKTQRENSSEKSGEAFNALNGEIKKYEEVQGILKNFFEANSESSGAPTDTGSASKETSAYEMLKNVSDVLGRGLPTARDVESPSLTLSEELIRRFARYVAASVRKVRERMAEDTSLPEAKIFSAEEFPEVTRGERVVTRQERAISRAERPVLSREADQTSKENYQVLGSVVLNREMAKTYELLNPPQKLHPFIRWLFYGRHLTQVRAERYLAARAKVKEICMRAKGPKELIRYRGKIMERFLPLPGDESGGTFELVRRV